MLTWIIGFLSRKPIVSLDCDEYLVAIAIYRKDVIYPELGKTITPEIHLLKFHQNDTGKRYTTIVSADLEKALQHPHLLVSAEIWRVIGELPEEASMVEVEESAQLIVFPGGRGDESA